MRQPICGVDIPCELCEGAIRRQREEARIYRRNRRRYFWSRLRAALQRNVEDFMEPRCRM